MRKFTLVLRNSRKDQGFTWIPLTFYHLQWSRHFAQWGHLAKRNKCQRFFFMVMNYNFMSHQLIHQVVIFSVFIILSCCTQKQEEKSAPIPVTPATALESYLRHADASSQWEVKDTFDVNGVQAFDLWLTSQQWREYTWSHQLTILVPEENKYDGALLFITGGSNQAGQPKWRGHDDETLLAFSNIASKNNAIVAIIRQVPNQPLFDELTEDALISFTLHHFKNDTDYTWPLLFPMVKAAVRAMDAVQEFSKESLQHPVNRFVVSGASKRGWTTWLTGASDERVAAIAPMVIDVLNMPVNLAYQLEVWKAYSEQIQDYVNLGIPQEVNTGQGDTLTQMIDPYSYRKKLTMPKLIMIGTNDEYWPVDAIKNYIDSIPGDNFIHYVPNAGHDLGDKKQALQALSAFFGNTLRKADYPDCSWDISENGKEITLSVQASSDRLIDAIVWSADSEDRDFRDEKWRGESLHTGKQASIVAKETYPASGFKAFYVDLKYEDPNGGEFTESTRMFVADEDEVFVK